MPVGSYTAIAKTVGVVSHNNTVVAEVKPVASNTATVVQIRPDDGRVVMRQADGQLYTVVPSSVIQVGSTTVTLVHEGT